MARIKDYASSRTTAAATTIVCPAPTIAEGDLLVAFLTADTGSQTWSNTGWTQLFTATNTCNMGILWKIASWADITSADFTFTGTVSETFECVLLSISDCNSATPFDGTGYATSNISSTVKTACATRTTTADDCLLLFLGVRDAATNTPSILEGPCTMLFGKDGASHSDSIAFGFQHTAGTTPANVYMSALGTLTAGVVGVVTISPAASGVGQKPTYVVADDSSYLNPFAGVAYNSDSAWATTIGQWLGNILHTIGGVGKTVAAGSTSTTSLADYGINAYHTVNAIRGYSTSEYYIGHHLQFATANRPNITDKQLMLHIMPQTPIATQTIDDAAAAGTRGIGIGLTYESPMRAVLGYNANTTVWLDETSDSNNSTTNDVLPPPQQLTTSGDALYIGDTAPFEIVAITVGTAASKTGGSLVWQYYNGAWTTFTPSGDPSNVCQTAATRGVLKLPQSLSATWTTTNPSGSDNLYWIRALCNQNPSALTTTPKITQMWRYKQAVWHVGGRGTSWGINRFPAVIHPSNTSGRIESRNFNSNAATAIADIACVTSQKLVITTWAFASAWAVGKTTLAGGTYSTPVNIPGICFAAADGKERMSVVRQGESQLMALQPIQFGDGGTNPIYLNLDSTSISFPRIYDQSVREVNFCSIPNFVGLTYYPGASDTIKHTNAAISSPSQFHWKIHASASSAASWDFSGLQIIGAGTIQLTAGIPINGVIFNGCDGVSADNARITGSTFKNSVNTSGALWVTTPTEMSACTGCAFEDNDYGIILTSTAPCAYDLYGLTFSNNASADIYLKATAGTATINVLGGGDTPACSSAGCTIVVSNPVTITLTSLMSGSEVRIYDQSMNELAGIESTDETGEFSYQYNYVAGTYVDIVIHHLNYIAYRLENYELPAADASLPISQQTDRQYSNPT